MPKTKMKRKWYDKTKWALLIGLLALAAAYGIGSRSLHTGSWQQYFMTIGAFILASNRLAHTVKQLISRKPRKA